jgi:molybdopterin-guanine dinucleotide biosynthesis protein A
VLAGGASSRFGADKAVAIVGSKTLLQHICERADPQVDCLMINRSAAEIPQFPGGYAFLPDDWPGEGPLAGVLAALECAGTHGFTYVASFPCDAPFFPRDLVSRLRDQLIQTKADFCVVRSGEREHHAFALWSAACASKLRAAFLAGLRSLRSVSGALTKTVADFPTTDETSVVDQFLNINTRDDLALAAKWLASHSVH